MEYLQQISYMISFSNNIFRDISNSIYSPLKI